MASKRKRPNNPAYQRDLAYIHDVGFGGFAAGSASGVLAILNQAGVGRGLVVDLGCGSGIWAKALVDAGYQVVGVDISEAMIQIARPRVPRAKFVNASFLDYQLPPCNAVTALGEVLGYLLDPDNSELALGRLLQRIYTALETGGVLVFDLMEEGTDKSRRQGFWEGDGWTCLVDFRYDQQLNQLQRRIVTFRRVGSNYRRHEETHRVQLYRASEIAAQLRVIGFRVRTVRHYGEYPLKRGRVGFIARKA